VHGIFKPAGEEAPAKEPAAVAAQSRE
jgi:hypothetical protein